MRYIFALAFIVATCASASATTYQVNKDQWNALSRAEQQKIDQILRQNGLLRPRDRLVPSPNVGPHSVPLLPLVPMLPGVRYGFPGDIFGDFGKEICKRACDVAAETAAGSCIAGTSGVALAICLAAAEAGRNECRNRC